jgi:hypothetical protein
MVGTAGQWRVRQSFIPACGQIAVYLRLRGIVLPASR